MMSIFFDNFGYLEAILSLEIITLLTALIFYQVAKLIAREDRTDPLVKFYRVFWLRFFSSVASIKDMDRQAAEYYARQAGFVGLGDVNPDQLASLDAAELVDVHDVNVQRNQGGAGTDDDVAPTAKAIGRRGPEDEDRISIARGGPTESREAQFIRQQKETPRHDEAPIRMTSNAEQQEFRAATSVVQIRVMPASQRDEIIGLSQNEVVIKLTTPPEDGRANGIVIELLAKQLGVRPYQISLLSGHYKLRKTVQIAGLDQATANARLQ